MYSIVGNKQKMKPYNQKLSFLFLILFPLSILGQECNCKETLDWAKSTFEKNDAGFKYILNKKGEQSYRTHNQLFFDKVNKINTHRECEKIVRMWFSFFRKSHIQFEYVGESEPPIKKHHEPIKVININEKIKSSSAYKLHTKFLNSSKPFIELLNKNTLYLRIPSFNGSQKQYIDSLISINRSKILSTENLIIDIRNGTGGNDNSYEELIPLIYTNPIRMHTIEYLSTPLNNQRMLDFATNTGMALQFGLNSTKEEMEKYQVDYDTLSNHLGEFVNLNSFDVRTTKMDTIYEFPKNIGIMINQNNVSTDEQFLLEAKQSKKVKLFGRTTKGGLDFSNLNLVVSPNEDYILVYTLSKSLRVPNLVVDDIGITPDYFIDKEIPDYKWIEFVDEILNE